MITLKLTIDQTNLILAALGDRPHREVNSLIAEIFNAAKKQLDDESTSPPADAPTDINGA